MYANVALKRWALLFPPRANREANAFIGLMQSASKGMRFEISQPKMLVNY